MKADDKKVAAIVIDGWKRGIFERHLRRPPLGGWPTCGALPPRDDRRGFTLGSCSFVAARCPGAGLPLLPRVYPCFEPEIPEKPELRIVQSTEWDKSPLIRVNVGNKFRYLIR